MTFVDQEIAHITNAMAISLQGLAETGVPVLPAAYWRERIHKLMDGNHLVHGQLCAVDTLLRQLDGFEAVQRWSMPAGNAA
ncbi:hypothetical protein [Paraburkholderia caballeronis]|uniref:Uncharacterized protein n=1 Tax=Paraburkholderia caballeronis TaxID=416943 RepID=A0A1H7EX35_9BURK|nr:hypothetical protein [Paraburkholderia caballeronis]PXW14570.1 hypothetical protein C7403_1288 [Paraburkholderia caballeronis]PXW93315.1 hypothetical protein C7407_1288 [Paraburkholderia caballeronis]RAJ87219.1 hypothetical protein C7409_1288 [Paraburkholderia caballeronis]TDV04998.1 hypothetical protein C7408_12935 [Paraburkholderia caballeronis]TDV08166.1 hypothetical protein C7406_13135 [Paraburkholderia caballeronis]